MDSLLLHCQVLFEAVWTASLIPMGNDTTISAMHAFGNHNMVAAVILSIIGGTLGQLFNYYIGVGLQKLKYTKNLTLSEDAYARFEYYFNRFGIYSLLFCWAPLCKLLPTLAGFALSSRRMVLLLSGAGYCYYYGQMLFI
jgi:membrane protein YqaA with SNARE-associated domain